MLVEALRKCWLGLIVYKITQVWGKHDILQPSQYGLGRSGALTQR